MTYTNEKNDFFGREEILGHLKRRVIDLKEGYRQNISLLGARYIGKSSILHNFLFNFEDDHVTVIYLDLENKDLSYFFYKFTSSLLYNFLKNKHLPVYDDLNLLLEASKDYIPYTVQVIKKIKADFDKNKSAQTFFGLFALPEIFTNETGQFCVLILDEFQNLDDLIEINVYEELGKKVMTQKKCLYVLSSSYVNMAKKILSEKLSLLFGNFETISIKPFDLQTSQNFIIHNLSDIRIGAQLRNFLTDFCGGHPFYLNLICKELVNLCAIYKQSEVYLPVLSQAIENTIFHKWGIISRHFELIVNELCLGKGNKTVSSILMTLSNNHHKIENLVDRLGYKKSYIQLKLNKLLDTGIIIKNGTSYYFKDKLFKYWIKYVFQKRLKDIELSPDKQRKQFKEEFHRSVENFNASSRKDFSSRIVELLGCFDNDSFNFKGRKYQLPFFSEVTAFKSLRSQMKNVEVVEASSDKTHWLFVIKKERFQENDIAAVLEEVKKMHRKPTRYVIVSLSELEETARLRALQEKFWVWSEEELNTLLTFFDKPYII